MKIPRIPSLLFFGTIIFGCDSAILPELETIDSSFLVGNWSGSVEFLSSTGDTVSKLITMTVSQDNDINLDTSDLVSVYRDDLYRTIVIQELEDDYESDYIVYRNLYDNATYTEQQFVSAVDALLIQFKQDCMSDDPGFQAEINSLKKKKDRDTYILNDKWVRDIISTQDYQTQTAILNSEYASELENLQSEYPTVLNGTAESPSGFAIQKVSDVKIVLTLNCTKQAYTMIKDQP